MVDALDLALRPVIVEPSSQPYESERFVLISIYVYISKYKLFLISNMTEVRLYHPTKRSGPSFSMGAKVRRSRLDEVPGPG